MRCRNVKRRDWGSRVFSMWEGWGSGRFAHGTGTQSRGVEDENVRQNRCPELTWIILGLAATDFQIQSHLDTVHGAFQHYPQHLIYLILPNHHNNLRDRYNYCSVYSWEKCGIELLSWHLILSSLTLVPMLFIMPDFGGAGIVVSNLISKHCLWLMRLAF